jgi:dephospho-CoA kinase
MRNILVVGGMGTGKTTLAHALKQDDIKEVYMSDYVIQIPMALQQKYPDLLDLSEKDYLERVFENSDIERLKPNREMFDHWFKQELVPRFGETISAKVAEYAAGLYEGRTLIDNIAWRVNAAYLKERGFYVVGLTASVEKQIDRRLSVRKSGDPTSREEMEKVVHRSNDFFEVPELLGVAEIVHDTENKPLMQGVYGSNEPTKYLREIVNRILEITQ